MSPEAVCSDCGETSYVDDIESAVQWGLEHHRKSYSDEIIYPLGRNHRCNFIYVYEDEVKESRIPLPNNLQTLFETDLTVQLWFRNRLLAELYYAHGSLRDNFDILRGKLRDLSSE